MTHSRHSLALKGAFEFVVSAVLDSRKRELRGLNKGFLEEVLPDLGSKTEQG